VINEIKEYLKNNVLKNGKITFSVDHSMIIVKKKD
jgi:hypothetical protein